MDKGVKPPLPDAIPDDPRYVKKNWAGYCSLHCSYPGCPYDTFYPIQFDIHYYNKHEKSEQPVARKATAVLYDQHGQLITEIEEKGDK